MCADHLLRLIFFSYLNRESNGTVYDKINEIAAIEEKIGMANIELKEIKNEWKLAAV